MSSSYYQYHQSHFQNPNPNTDPQFNPLPTTTDAQASAPPVSDYSYYSTGYLPYPQATDHHAPNLASPYPPNPNSQLSDASLPPYYSFDHNQTALNYDDSNPNYEPGPNSSNSHVSAPYGASTVPNYANLYSPSISTGSFGAEPGPEQGFMYGHGGYGGDEGVYRYNGGKAEPYGARGSGSQSSGGGPAAFDDYGRPIGISNGEERNGNGSGAFSKIVKAAPKTEAQQDVQGGVQKFRVKLLSEGVGQIDMDVLCQIGLDGIWMLDPATSRTQKIYPLDTVTRWEVLDSHIFAFWAKSSIEMEPRRIRLKSNRYTSSNILDTVAAASIQLKEMNGSNRPSDPLKASEQPFEKKKGLADWMSLMKPGIEEKDHWVPDEAVTKCTACRNDFGAFLRKHHCRNCGDIFCDKCTQGRIALTADENDQPVRVCDRCMAEVTQRLSNSKEAAVKVSGLHSHEDLAKKLQEEMDKNRKTSTGLKSHGSDVRMREVVCPTCTVHLQVQVPVSGSETIECSVCQHPFLVSAH